jgi:alpha-L-fucosidase
MAVTYPKTSPYYATENYADGLDIMANRKISKFADDVAYRIDAVYNYRPDMLAFDLYGNSALWWVFAARNPDSLKDPTLDFVAGLVIYLPKKDTLMSDLGL